MMCSCLLFLTGINFIVYGSHAKSISIALQLAGQNASDETSPEKPVEEKSSSGSVNLQEEYVHEFRLVHSLLTVDNTKQYHILDEAKLAIVHFELISPPPDL